jgi:hypothetical protein
VVNGTLRDVHDLMTARAIDPQQQSAATATSHQLGLIPVTEDSLRTNDLRHCETGEAGIGSQGGADPLAFSR